MTNTLDNKYTKPIYITSGILLILCFMGTWMMATMSDRGNAYRILHCMAVLLTGILFWTCNYFYSKGLSDSALRQIQVIDICMHIIFTVITVADLARGDSSIFLLIADLMWVFTLECICRMMFAGKKMNLHSMKQFCYENRQIIIGIILYGAVLIAYSMVNFRWNDESFYQMLWRINAHSLTTLTEMKNFGFGLLFCIVRMIINIPDIAIPITLIVLHMSSIAAIQGIIRKWMKDTWQQKTVILVYAILPLLLELLGRMDYFSIIWVALYGLVLLIFFFLHKKWILFGVTALLYVML